MPLTAEQKSVDFVHADLTFVIHPDRKAIEGRSILDFRVRQPISRIHFDLDPNLSISSIAVNGSELDKAAWSNPEGLTTVTLPRRFDAGETLRLRVNYGGRPHAAAKAPWEGGFVWSKTDDGKPWIATAVQGEGCDLFWPCFDNSLVEIGSVDLHIDVPEGLVAPGNGRFMGASKSEGRRTWHWRAARPNNYAISLNVAPYKLLKAPYRSRFGNTVPLYFWYLPGHEKDAARLFQEFAPTLEFFERRIGPYPFGSEKVAAVETPHLGMEHQTINAYGNGFKPAAEGYDWLFHHEFSHEWFGNQLTNRNWDDMWLHEGFGTYMQPLSIEDRLGRMAYNATLWKQRASLMNRFPLVSGRPRLEHEVYNKETGPGGDIYTKGSWTLHSLRGLIGDEAFFRAITRQVYGRADPRPGNFQPRFGSTNEFVAIVNQETKRDLKWFFDVYVRSAKLPRLKTERSGTTLNLQWLTQGGRPFPMPVDVSVDGKLQTVPMAGGKGRIAVEPRSHWLIDPDSKLLRQDDALDRFRDWTEAQSKLPKKP